MKKNGFFSILCKATISILIVFACGEIIFRAFFPEYRGYILTKDITYGKKRYDVAILGGKTRSRTSDLTLDIKPTDHIILEFGDSVSVGYGLAFEDIFWNYWQRMLKLEGSDVKVISINSYGVNYTDNFLAMRTAVKKYKELTPHIDGVVYQFNFNDILPYDSADLKHMEYLESKSSFITQMIKKLVYVRTVYLNHSVMLRVLANKITHALYRNSKIPCERLGIEALGEYSYCFGSKGLEETSQKIWDRFESDLKITKTELGDIPFIILISPIAELIEPEMKINVLSRPRRFDCATIDPRKQLTRITQESNINLIDPSVYMKTNFENYIKGDNPVRFYHINDDDHFNEIGAKYFSEYSYMKIFKEGLIPIQKNK